MGRKSTGWVDRLEKKYKLSADVLIPALLTEHGMEWLAEETGMTMATIWRWCKKHGIERHITYVKGE